MEEREDEDMDEVHLTQVETNKMFRLIKYSHAPTLHLMCSDDEIITALQRSNWDVQKAVDDLASKKADVNMTDKRSYDSKVETPFVGLINQGATCYMNSMLQTLYHIPYFRKAMYQMQIPQTESCRMPRALQNLFYDLQHSKTSVTTNEITEAVGKDFSDTRIHHDVQEFNMKLRAQLEATETALKHTFKDLFEGSLSSTVECNGENSTRVESFYDLQLDVIGRKDVYESFDEYVKGVRLEDYKTEGQGCQDATKTVSFLAFPTVLQLHLKRFEFDPQTKITTKINDPYEFPLELDLNREGSNYLSPDAEKDVSNRYALYSVLVHSGGVGTGHYYAYIRPTLSGQWFEFNDARVMEANWENVTEQYGGKTSSSAYMLVYVRQSKKDEIFCDVNEKDIPEHLRSRRLKERFTSDHTEQRFQYTRNQNTRKRKRNLDVTHDMVDNNTPPPLSDRPINCVYDPTDVDIITILERRICNLKVPGDMVRRVDIYEKRPYELVRWLRPYLVNGIRHYLVFTSATIMGEGKTKKEYLDGECIKIRRPRNVGEGPIGYWTAMGEREMITDLNGILIGSKLKFSYHEGHLMEREKGRQRSIWRMTEYRIEGKVKAKRTKDQLIYTICKLHLDHGSAHAMAFQKSEQEKGMAMQLRNDLLNLKRRQGLKYMTEEDGNCDVMVRKAMDLLKSEIIIFDSRSLIPKYNLLYDDFPLSHKEVGSFQESGNKYGKENKGPTPTKPLTEKDLPLTENDPKKLGKTVKEYLTSEGEQGFYTDFKFSRIDKKFMRDLLKNKLSNDIVDCWVDYLMKYERQPTSMWTIHYSMFDQYLAPDVDGSTSDEEVDMKNRINYYPFYDEPVSMVNVKLAYIPVCRYDHWYLVELNLNDFHVKIYESLNHHRGRIIERVTKKWRKMLHWYLTDINFWENRGVKNPENFEITIAEEDYVVGPVQDDLIACGVMMCRALEKLVKGQSLDLEVGKRAAETADEFREYMAHVIYSKRCPSSGQEKKEFRARREKYMKNKKTGLQNFCLPRV